MPAASGTFTAKAKAPAVIVMHEVPGVSAEVVRVARKWWTRLHGVHAHLFGTAGTGGSPAVDVLGPAADNASREQVACSRRDWARPRRRHWRQTFRSRRSWAETRTADASRRSSEHDVHLAVVHDHQRFVRRGQPARFVIDQEMRLVRLPLATDIGRGPQRSGPGEHVVGKRVQGGRKVGPSVPRAFSNPVDGVEEIPVSCSRFAARTGESGRRRSKI
jgi:hypothetical protein